MKKVSYPYILVHRVALLLLVLLIGVSAARAQAPTWQTAVALGSDKSSGGAASYSVFAMAPDAGGNRYLTGIFHGTVRLGGTTLTSTNTELRSRLRSSC